MHVTAKQSCYVSKVLNYNNYVRNYPYYEILMNAGLEMELNLNKHY